MKHSLDHFYDGWVEAMQMHPEWRRGQAFFNVLCNYDPAAAEAMRGTDIDPFYDNKRIPQAIWFVAERWENE